MINGNLKVGLKILAVVIAAMVFVSPWMLYGLARAEAREIEPMKLDILDIDIRLHDVEGAIIKLETLPPMVNEIRLDIKELLRND